MNFSPKVLKNDEKAIYNLRSLYGQYGYSLYKVSKFEEYDLYARNKSFLVSQNILSFTDTNGKLLALKPDVTLSIIKNIPDGDNLTHKLCYNENVYRPSADSDGFREIMQTGLECIGNIDLYAECEVIMLAMRSLESISDDYILDLSHMGIIDAMLEAAGVQISEREDFIRLIESKNVNSLNALCSEKNISFDIKDKLCALTELYMPVQKALPILKELIVGDKMMESYEELVKICDIMSAYGLGERLYLDFSIVNDANYYDGVIFKGFINGIPNSLLSGGRYDRLLKRLGKSSGAIGFAVYLDRLERFDNTCVPFDVDTVLLYDKGADMTDIINAQKQLLEQCGSVMTVSAVDADLRYRKLFKLTEGGIDILETND